MYNQYGISGDAAYYEARDATTSDVTSRAWTLGACYTYGNTTIRGSFVNYRNPSSHAALSNVDVVSIGGRIIATPFITLSAGVYTSLDRNVTENKSVLFGAGAVYSLSKQTLVYRNVAVVHTKGAMGTRLSIKSPERGLPALPTTSQPHVLLHSF